MKIISLLMVSAWMGLAAVCGQDVDTLISEGRGFLAAHNLTNANARFAAAVVAAPQNQTANALYGATRLLCLYQNASVNTLLDRIGMGPTNRNIYEWTAKLATDTNGDYLPPAGVSARAAVDELRTTVLNEVEGSLTNFAQVKATNFIVTLTSNETAMAEVTVDYGDIQMLRAMAWAAEFGIYMINAHDLDVQLAALRALYDADNLSVGSILKNFPKLLTFANTNDLARAKTAFENAVELYNTASAFIRSRPPNTTRLFNWDAEDEDEARFRQTLADVKASFTTPTPLNVDTNIAVYGAKMFDGTGPWRRYLPQFQGQRVVLGSVTDSTFGGMVTGLDEELIEQLWGKMFDTVPTFGLYEHAAQDPAPFYLRLSPWHGYVVEASTNLKEWSRVDSFVASEQRRTLQSARGFEYPARFYRLAEPEGLMPPPPNDVFSNRVDLGIGKARCVGYLASATRKPDEQIHYPAEEMPWYSSQQVMGHSVWYTWEAPTTGPIRMQAADLEETGEYVLPIVDVFTGTAITSLQRVAAGTHGCEFEAQAGAVYQIAIDCVSLGGTGGRMDGFKLMITAPPVLAVASPAANAEYVAGSNIPIQFIAADPDGTIEDLRLSIYSWTLSREMRFEGSTGSYVLTNAPAGSYYITITATDDCGVAVQDQRTITVKP